MEQISHLATPAYWCDIYEREREVLANQGAVGEEWFSEKQDSILNWINENWESWNPQSNKKNAVCLDVGTGNGMFPLRLAGLGFGTVHGIDYVKSAVKLCREVRDRRDHISELSGINCSNQKVLFTEADLQQGHCSQIDCAEDQEISDFMQFQKYDLIHDKGTLDVFVLQNQFHIGCQRLLAHYSKPGTILVLTTCNLTGREAIDQVGEVYFARQQDGAEVFRFELVEELHFEKFSFGGYSGQSVSTVAFRVVGC